MKLSLCIIARNEEEMLPGCLASVAGIVDEIILVDTGSSDRTIRLGARAGARIIKMAWCDDFSAVRNESIAHATGDWILQLDADERLSPTSGAKIRAAIANADFDCGLVRLHNASKRDASPADVISGSARLGEAMSLPRLLRRTSDLRYDGIVHESVGAWIRERGNRLRFIDADIIHLGSLPEVRANRNKVARNVDLLKKRAAEETDDFTAYSYLAFEALAQNQIDEAAKASDAGWKIALSGHHAPGTSVLRLAVARGLIQKERGDLHGVLETARVAERMEGPHPDLWMLRGCAREMLARNAKSGSKLRYSHLRRALEAHRAALSLSTTDYVQRFLVGAGSWASSTRAATVLLELGQGDAARALLAPAIAKNPNDAETRLAMAEAEIATAAPEAALARIEPMLGDGPDAWLLAALACDRLGALQDALDFLRQAGARSSKGYVAPHRRELHLDLMALTAAYAGSPAVGRGPVGALTALMAKKPFDDNPTSFDIAALPLASTIRNLVGSEQIGAIETLLTARAEAAFPGISAAVVQTLRGLGMDVGQDERPQPIVVVSSSVEVARFVAKVLGAHSRLFFSGIVERADQLSTTESPREIACATSLTAAKALLANVPRGTLLFVSLGDEARPELPAGSLTLSYAELLERPVGSLSRIFAEIGEPADELSLRKLIESYPGRSRVLRAAPSEDRALRAARPSTDSPRATEVFP